MNENVMVEVYKFDEPLIQKIDSIIDDCIRDCHNKYFHTFDHICDFDSNFTNIDNNESVNFTISDETMGMYELNRKISFARGNGFIFIQLKKLTIKNCGNFSLIKIHYYLKLRIPIMHRQFFRKLSQNHNYIRTHCNDRRNPFHFACHQWYL